MWSLDDDVSEYSSSESLWAEVLYLRKQVENKQKVIDLAAAAIIIDAKASVVVVRTASQISSADAEQISKIFSEARVVFGPPDLHITSLSDQELESVGLRRVSSQGSDRQHYDNMLAGKC